GLRDDPAQAVVREGDRAEERHSAAADPLLPNDGPRRRSGQLRGLFAGHAALILEVEMNNHSQSHPWRRAIVALLSLQMALGPLASPAYAAVTLLADEPIGFSPSAPPNIMLTIDDSTSMLSDFLPDYVIGSVPGASPAVGGFCRNSSGTMNTACGFIGSPTTPPYIRSTANFPFGNAANVSAARG